MNNSYIKIFEKKIIIFLNLSKPARFTCYNTAIKQEGGEKR